MIDKLASLTPETVNIVQHKHTEPPGLSADEQFKGQGTYLCRRCGWALFRGRDQFISHCGWPSFDEAITHHIVMKLDSDGQRTEILCSRCQAHLGHVFHGEQLTDKNQRYCVNSLAIEWVKDSTIQDSEEGIYAGGCFWGMEHYFQQLPGVLKTQVGYSGGKLAYPSYKQVCRGNSGHLEVVRVLYDPQQLDYHQLSRYFFEIHDPTQHDGQGPDIGEQYLSAIFYFNDAQKTIASNLIKKLNTNGYSVATRLLPASIFWVAEDKHQHYYQNNQQQPYCHYFVKRFNN